MKGTTDDTAISGADPDATMLPDGATPQEIATDLGPGVKVDRYTIIERVGAGAMGVVFSAWDAELDRRVALKLVHGDGYGGSAELLGEAKALAKLSHPNVVTVFDVGPFGDGLFIAMEYLRGQTLAQWQEANPDAPWSEVVGLYIAAGAGLAAAHEAGLVHRDFKPANVIVTEGGGVKVLDFGLAKAGEEEATSRGGTPRYMAPEQHRGGPVDARSDQFAFSIALYEALFGRHPFGGDTAMEISLNVQTTTPHQPAIAHSAPTRIRHAIRRGLEAEPQARHPSMEAYLHALDPAAVTRRRGLVALVGASVLLVGAATWVTARRDDPCADTASPLDDVWNDRSRAALQRNLDSDTIPASLAALATARVEAFASAWSEGRTQACRAAKVLHTETETVLELRYHCLDQRLDRFEVALDALTSGTDASLVSAADIVENLPKVERCGDLEALRAEFPPPEDPEARARVRALEILLEEIEPKYALDPEGVREVLTQALKEADAIDHPPVRVRTRRSLGSVLAFLGHHAEGMAMVEESVQLGLRSNAREETVSALFELARLRSALEQDTQTALLLNGFAGSLASGLPDGVAARRRDHQSKMEIYLAGQMGKEAVEVGRAWIARLEAEGTIDELPGFHARSRMAYALTMIGEYAEAERLFEGLLDHPSIGDAHPLIARSYTYRARLRTLQGDYDGALSDHLAAYERFARLYGESHSNAVGRLGDAARTLVEANRLEEAMVMAERALQGLAAGPQPAPMRPTIVSAEYLAEAAMHLGKLDEAERALDQAERAGSRGRAGFDAWRALARARIAEERGDAAVARREFERVRSQTTDEGNLAKAAIGLAIASAREGLDDGAKQTLLDPLDRPELDAVDRARASWGLAVLEAGRQQPETARRHVEQARAELKKAPAYERMLLRKLDALERTLPPAAKRDGQRE